MSITNKFLAYWLRSKGGICSKIWGAFSVIALQAAGLFTGLTAYWRGCEFNLLPLGFFRSIIHWFRGRWVTSSVPVYYLLFFSINNHFEWASLNKTHSSRPASPLWIAVRKIFSSFEGQIFQSCSKANCYNTLVAYDYNDEQITFNLKSHSHFPVHYVFTVSCYIHVYEMYSVVYTRILVHRLSRLSISSGTI